MGHWAFSPESSVRLSEMEELTKSVMQSNGPAARLLLVRDLSKQTYQPQPRNTLRSRKTHLQHPPRLVPIVILVVVPLMLMPLRARGGLRKVAPKQPLRRGRRRLRLPWSLVLYGLIYITPVRVCP